MKGKYPRDLLNACDCHLLPTHRLTQLFSPETKPPNLQGAWNTRLNHCGININWPVVWSSVGTFLTTPANDKTWFKLVHRGLMVNGKESTGKECRLCNFHAESQVHLLTCVKLSEVRQLVASLLMAMGMKPAEIHDELTWLLGINSNGNLLPLLILPFCESTGDTYTQQWRRFSHSSNYKLPKSAAALMKPIGSLRLTDSKLAVKPTLISLLHQQGIACEYLQVAPSSPPAPSRPTNDKNGNKSCYTNKNNLSLNIHNNSRAQAGISTTLLAQLRQREHDPRPNLANGQE
eukprot:6213457-Pleurochrysis_carterae.AAC.4